MDVPIINPVGKSFSAAGGFSFSLSSGKGEKKEHPVNPVNPGAPGEAWPIL